MDPQAEVEAVSRKEDGSGAGMGTVLHIIGKNEFNNEILAKFLEEHTGIFCRKLHTHKINDEIEQFADRTNLILMDYNCLKKFNQQEIAELDEASHAPNCILVLFQVKAARKAERNLFSHGARGVLYDDQPISIYPRALRCILDGELWYPRHILEEFFLQNEVPSFVPNKIWYNLTARQKQILRLLAAGKSNREIAEKLCLSQHTVKTHIYNLYKRLNVRNRLQASVKLTE